ncbi:MAG: DUF5686 family protein [Bacteroidales bacterium]
MQTLRQITILAILILFSMSSTAKGKGIFRPGKAYEMGDSIMEEVMKHGEKFCNYVRAYQGTAYLKGTTKIEKSNFLLDWFPHAFPFDRHMEGSIFEILNEVKYSCPNHFIIAPLALNSTNKHPVKNQHEIISLLNLNVYSPTSFNDKFIMPGSKKAKGIYEYKLQRVIKGSHSEWYKIRFKPKRLNLNLISGFLYIKKGTPVIRMITAEGRLDISRFKLTTRLGQTYEDFLLPVETNIQLTYNVLNNVSVNNYHLLYKYDSITIDSCALAPKKDFLDHTLYYEINKKSIPVIQDSVFWQSQRKYLLEEEEEILYEQKQLSDSIAEIPVQNDTLRKMDYLKLSERLVTPASFKSESLYLKYSGFLNPSMISYSKRDGFTIRQRFRMRKDFRNESFLGFLPEIGYRTGSKELFYKFEVDYAYNPRKMGGLSLSFRNGNSGFSSAFIDEVNKQLDSTKYNFDHLKVDYYRDYHLRMENSNEITNGLLYFVGISYNYRRPIKNGDRHDSIPADMELIKNSYADFVPYIRFSWTPNQPYRYEGKQKIYLQSKYPTLTFEYAKGFSDILQSTSEFGRWELDIHQTISLHKLRYFRYRIGAGAFFDQKGEYFINYTYFWRNTYPSSWNDHIGGVFNLLDQRWYYSSPSYFQTHFMYESPFLLLHFFRSISRFVLSERVYLSHLYTPAKPTYLEIGYGLGNYVFNVGLFASFKKGGFDEAGFRFTFELGKYW